MPVKDKQPQNDARRKLLKTLAAGSGAIVATKALPEQWTRPVVNSVVLPAHAQTTSSREIVLTDVLVEGTYSGEQLAAGPFFSQKNLFGVQFPQQPAELVITSSEIIYKVGGEESSFPHGMKTLKADPTVAYRGPESSSIAKQISEMLVPTAYALDQDIVQVLFEARIVSPTIVNNRNITIEQEIRPAVEESIINLQFRAQVTAQCPTTATTIPGSATLILGGLVVETLRSSTIDVDSVPDFMNIPSVGALFRSDATSVNRRQLCIIITPQIVDPD